MKKLSIILVSLLMVLNFSCSEEFLTKAPLGSTSENVFYSAKGIDALLTGTYSMVRGSALWDVSWGASIQNWTYGSVASDDAYKGSEVGDQTPVNDIERWEVQPTNGYIADKWRLCLGMGVFRANKVLNVIKQSEADVAKNDLGRFYILPLLERQSAFQNNPKAPKAFQYWAIDGFDIPAEEVLVWRFDKTPALIELSSDGYENYPAESSVKAYEEDFAKFLKEDPQRIKSPSTKGLQEGNVSFDDRAVLIYKGK